MPIQRWTEDWRCGIARGTCHYHGVRYVVKLGPWLLPTPEWLVLGHTTIVEVALDDTHFAMDFRLTHPLLGQVFRYAGEFEADAEGADGQNAHG